MWSKSQLKILPLTYLIMTLLVILLTVVLKNKSRRIRMIPLAIIAIIMFIGEIIKISLSIISRQFTTWQIPLHYCSLFILWFLLSCFSSEKSKNTFQALSFAMGIPVIILLLLYPSSMLRNSTDFLFISTNFYFHHNFFYHFFIALFVVLMLTLKIYKPKIEDLKHILIYFYIWVIIATIGSNILNESYANLLYSDFASIDKIRIKYGYFVYLLFLYVGGFVIITGIFLTSVLIKNSFSLKKKAAEEAVEVLNT